MIGTVDKNAIDERIETVMEIADRLLHAAETSSEQNNWGMVIYELLQVRKRVDKLADAELWGAKTHVESK